MRLKFVVAGPPQGKARPRMNTFTRRTYTPAKTVKYENHIKKSYNTIYRDTKIDGPISAKIVATFEIPKSISKKKKEELVHKPNVHKPDMDNIQKSIFDALNGIAYYDDSAVAEIYAMKKYGKNPQVEVYLKNFDDDKKIITPIHFDGDDPRRTKEW